MEQRFLITGNPQSKANSRRLVSGKRKDGRGYTRSIKSSTALKYEETCIRQLIKQKTNTEPISVPVGVEITIWYQSRRSDLDPSIILDCMQKARVYKNDNLVDEMILHKQIDKENPRADVYVYEL